MLSMRLFLALKKIRNNYSSEHEEAFIFRKYLPDMLDY